MKSRLHSFCKINQACGINQSALTTVTFWGLLDSRQRPFPERARNNEPFSWHMVASQLQICSACLPRQPGTFCRCELQFEVWRLRPWGVAFDVYGADVLVRSCDQQHGKREINTWKLSEINRNHGTCINTINIINLSLGCDQTTLVTSTMHQWAPGVLGALTNVLLLIYTSTQYSGWSATEKAECRKHFIEVYCL